MENTTVDPLVVTFFGLTIVFFALLSLVGILTLLGRLLGDDVKKKKSAAAPAAASTAVGQDTDNADDEERLRRVAIAAFVVHQSHRVSVRGPEPASEWGISGRFQATRRAH